MLICSGNIGRSPMAAALLEWLLEQEGMGQHHVSSAGTTAIARLPATEAATAAAARMGLDLSHHRARQVDRPTLESADLILCMTGEQREALMQMAPSAEEKVMLLGSLAPDLRGEEDIDDPVGTGPGVHYQCLRKMEKALRRLVGHLKAGTI